MKPDVEEIIDYMINEFDDYHEFDFHSAYQKKFRQQPDSLDILNIMKRKNLVKALHGNKFVLTDFGVEVKKSGGWLKYNQQQEEAASKENTIRNLTIEDLQMSIKTSKFSFTQLKYWWLIGITGVILSALASVGIQALYELYFKPKP